MRLCGKFIVKTPDASNNSHVLIVDDDPGQRSLLNSFLSSQGIATVAVDSGEKALELLRSRTFSMMISDVRMPGISGLETLRRARKENASLPVLLVTAYTDVRDAVSAMRDGALNYLSKPIDLDELLACVHQATGVTRNTPLKFEDKKLPGHVIAHSPVMRAVFRDISLVASSESRVLITGESGVGKEIVADVLHNWSHRVKGPLIKVNCAAIPENLLESELFGHERGAFTGATSQRIGRFEEANCGTLFLDEIGEMSPQLQAKLLHVAQDGRFQRIGSNRPLETNARLLTATNRNLEEEVKAGRFREDLYYRLNVVEINIPPLRERPEDILALATHFTAQFSQNRSKLAAGTANCLERYAWPGNIRELRNAIERAVLLSRSELILPEHLPSKVRVTDGLPNGASVPLATGDAPGLQEIERQAVIQALHKNNFNRTDTAKALGISRRTLIYKIQKLRELGYEVDLG